MNPDSYSNSYTKLFPKPSQTLHEGNTMSRQRFLKLHTQSTSHRKRKLKNSTLLELRSLVRDIIRGVQSKPSLGRGTLQYSWPWVPHSWINHPWTKNIRKEKHYRRPFSSLFPKQHEWHGALTLHWVSSVIYRWARAPGRLHLGYTWLLGHFTQGTWASTHCGTHGGPAIRRDDCTYTWQRTQLQNIEELSQTHLKKHKPIF